MESCVDCFLPTFNIVFPCVDVQRFHATRCSSGHTAHSNGRQTVDKLACPTRRNAPTCEETRVRRSSGHGRIDAQMLWRATTATVLLHTFPRAYDDDSFILF